MKQSHLKTLIKSIIKEVYGLTKQDRPGVMGFVNVEAVGGASKELAAYQMMKDALGNIINKGAPIIPKKDLLFHYLHRAGGAPYRAELDKVFFDADKFIKTGKISTIGDFERFVDYKIKVLGGVPHASVGEMTNPTGRYKDDMQSGVMSKKISGLTETEETDEQSVSGGAGAYSTPFAFKKTKNEAMDRGDAQADFVARKIWGNDVSRVQYADEDRSGGQYWVVVFKSGKTDVVRLTDRGNWYSIDPTTNKWIPVKGVLKKEEMNEISPFVAGAIGGALAGPFLKIIGRFIKALLNKGFGEIPMSEKTITWLFGLVRRMKGAHNISQKNIDELEQEVREAVKSGELKKIKDLTEWVNNQFRTMSEMTGTGAVAGYQTPFAFSKKKSGSQRAIDATTKLGYKVVGPSPRV